MKKDKKMKKEIFLSFKPNYFRPILYDIKKYEYRKRFCKEPVTAYLYLSAPIQEVIGIMELGKPLIIKDIIYKFYNDNVIKLRLERCMESGEMYAIPINSLQLYTNPITINKMKSIDPKFKVPQGYLDITKYERIYEYLKSQTMHKVEFYNDHNTIYKENIGCTCIEMEKMDEFKLKDEYYSHNTKYDIIRCGYLNTKEIITKKELK